MSSWENFFIAEVGASAALTGLIFVAVSINLTRILSIPKLPSRALLALVLLMTILIVSSLLLVPGQPLLLLGSEVLFVALISWALVLRLDASMMQKTERQYRRLFLINLAMSQFAAIPYIIAGITILVSGYTGIYWLVPAIIFSFIKAILDAWILLIEINR